MQFSTLFGLARQSVMAWIDDYAPSMGAAIAYYTVFSIAPLLVIVIALAGLFFGEDAVRGALEVQMRGLIGQEGATAIQGLVADAREPTEGIVASGISIAVLVVGATTVFAEIQSALDRIWHVPEKAKPSGLWGLLRARFLSFGLILTLAFLLMSSLILSAAVAAVGTWMGGLLPGWEVLLQVFNLALSLGIGTVMFAAIYKLMPSTPIAWRDVWVGAVVTSLLFELGKVLIGLYLGKAGISSSYAAAGAIAVILIWVYYAAQIFLLGAEFTKAYAQEHGSKGRNGPKVEGGDPGGRRLMGHGAPQTGPAGRSDTTRSETASTPPAAAARTAAPARGTLGQRMAVAAGLWLVQRLLRRWLTKRERRLRRGG